MWVATQRVFICLGAAMALLIYALEFQKSCGQVRPHQCMANLRAWAVELAQDTGLLSRPQVADAPADKGTTPPSNVRKVAIEKSEPPPGLISPPPKQESVAPAGAPKAPVEPPQQPTREVAIAPAPPPQRPVRTEPASKVAPSPRPQVTDHRFTVVNGARQELMFFYATSCDVQHWGSDLLGKDVIGSGQRHTFMLRNNGRCCFDLRAKFRDDEQVTKMGADICNMTSWTVTDR